MNQHTIPIKNIDKRVCGECTKCCEGYLNGDAYGHKFGKGIACYFLIEKRCSIYPNHPKQPCKDYNCYWLEHIEIPDYMRPDKSIVLMTSCYDYDHQYIKVQEAGKKIDSVMLANIVQYFLGKNINLECQVDGKYYYFVSTDFMSIVTQKLKEKKNEI